MEITVRFLDFPEWLALQKEKFGDKFDPSGLALKFAPYFGGEQRKRIEVRFAGGHARLVGSDKVKRGYVGVTPGPKPEFLLLLRSDSWESSYLLKEEDELLQTFAKTRR